MTITYVQGQEYPRQAFKCGSGQRNHQVARSRAGQPWHRRPAEIVASAILENARGDVVGDKTFGDAPCIN